MRHPPTTQRSANAASATQDETEPGLVEMAQLLDCGAATATDLAQRALSRIALREPSLRAWAHHDADLVLAQARAADDRRKAGRALSALDGVPVGIKDNIDTMDWPTEMGSPIHRGRRPARDAAVVDRIKRLGMVIMGKTVTTPFGMNAPAPTRNPVDPSRTLGASSVGSAAAVAAGMVPLTINTQNTSSTTRPASYAGLFAFKPTHGVMSMQGCLTLSPSVAHLAFMASSLEDLALFADHLLWPNDGQERPADRGLLKACQSTPVPKLRIAVVRGPWWDRATRDGETALRQFAERADIGEIVNLPACFEGAIEAHLRVIAADVAVTLADEYEQARDLLPADAVVWIETGRAMAAVDYVRARRLRSQLVHDLLEAMAGFDALITLSTPGAPPQCEASLGDGTFSMPWTFCGLPTMSLPLLHDPEGLPIGLQVITRPGDHLRLFAASRDLIDLAK